ncbi:hypothetical protein N7510_004801 [Penicillium lagena]|uniref:uncharacterized protein n=1 Tax=Penicillium lagena TaxID=94218 RepID=UPI00253FBA5A|nr:uncharacterized protein N7510_004801 [Penicillium lagena]KAJ5620817.1 hypothetical protein N7510_004801 [Penicillium lagena]
MFRSQGNSTDQMGDADRELAETEARNLMPPPPVPPQHPLPTHPPLPIPPWRTVSPLIRLPGPDELASPFANPVWYPEPPLPAWHSNHVPATTHHGLLRHSSSSTPEPRSPRTYGDFIPVHRFGTSPPELPLEQLPHAGVAAPNTSSRDPAVLARNVLTTFFGVEPAGPPGPREPSTSVMLGSLTPIDPQLMLTTPMIGDMPYTPSNLPNPYTTVPASYAAPVTGAETQLQGALTEAATSQMPVQHVQNSPSYPNTPQRSQPSLNTVQGMHPMPVEREYALQSWLVRQQLLAGIPIDHLEPMQGPRSRQQQVSPSGIHTRYRTPALLMITEDGIQIPRLPLAQFQGTLQPLPDLPGPHGNQIPALPALPPPVHTGNGDVISRAQPLAVLPEELYPPSGVVPPRNSLETFSNSNARFSPVQGTSSLYVPAVPPPSQASNAPDDNGGAEPYDDEMELETPGNWHFQPIYENNGFYGYDGAGNAPDASPGVDDDLTVEQIAFAAMRLSPFRLSPLPETDKGHGEDPPNSLGEKDDWFVMQDSSETGGESSSSAIKGKQHQRYCPRQDADPFIIDNVFGRFGNFLIKPGSPQQPLFNNSDDERLANAEIAAIFSDADTEELKSNSSGRGRCSVFGDTQFSVSDVEPDFPQPFSLARAFTQRPEVFTEVIDYLNMFDIFQLQGIHKTIDRLILYAMPQILRNYLPAHDRFVARLFPYENFVSLRTGVKLHWPATANIAPDGMVMRLEPKLNWIVWLKIRLDMAKEIFAYANRVENLLPSRGLRVLLKMWHIMEIPDNFMRMWIIKHKQLWPNKDLRLAVRIMKVLGTLIIRRNPPWQATLKRLPRVFWYQKDLSFLYHYLINDAPNEWQQFLPYAVRTMTAQEFNNHDPPIHGAFDVNTVGELRVEFWSKLTHHPMSSFQAAQVLYKDLDFKGEIRSLIPIDYLIESEMDSRDLDWDAPVFYPGVNASHPGDQLIWWNEWWQEFWTPWLHVIRSS